MSGNQDALKASSAYPTNFGRAFALAYFCLNDKQGTESSEPTIRTWVDKMIQDLPKPGEMSQEEPGIDIDHNKVC